jgi:mRNA turnover protein 4
MPKSKRAKIEHLSQVDKKTRKDNDKLFEAAQERARESPYIYVYQLENMRTNHLQDIRKALRDSRYAPHSLPLSVPSPN